MMKIKNNNSESVVYKVTNKINGKSYIGMTANKLKFRITEHTRRGHLLTNAIKKYGKENFEVSILFESEKFEELNKFEILNIKKYNSIYPNGYNIVAGGGGTVGYNHKEETKLKMSKNRARYYKEDNHFYGKSHSEEAKKIMSETHKGKTISPEHIKSMVKKINKKVVNLDTLEVFDSVFLASESVKKAPSNITRVCNGGRKTAGGYRWLHYEKYIKLSN